MAVDDDPTAEDDSTLSQGSEESRPGSEDALRLSIQEELRKLYATEPPSRARTARAFVTAARAMMSWALHGQNTSERVESSGQASILESIGALPRLAVLYSEHVLNFTRSLSISINVEDEEEQINCIITSSEIFLDACNGARKWINTVLATDAHVITGDLYDYLAIWYEKYISGMSQACDDILAHYDGTSTTFDFSVDLDSLLLFTQFSGGLLEHLSSVAVDSHKDLLASVGRRRNIFSEEGELLRYETILECSLCATPNRFWTSLLGAIPFPDQKPAPLPSPAAPDAADWKFAPRKGVLDRFFPSRARKKEKDAEDRLEKATADWRDLKSIVEQWESRNASWVDFQLKWGAAVTRHYQRYLSGAAEEVIGYCHEILCRQWSFCPTPGTHSCAYQATTKLLVVDYQLPSPDDVPAPAPKGRTTSRAAATKNPRYDNILYQLCLGALHQLFAADEAGALDSIAFNGFVDSVDPGTGHKVNACVLTIHVGREEFQSINLNSVDAKACFKRLKGVGSSELHGLTPVAPLVRLGRADPRIIEGYAVAEGLDTGKNLAAMDWQDFEHLIRELFEREFSKTGGEVKVTRASRDGGVDAIVYDPDPIRGGKIVIQAKRYTNTVGVSAVRDLYGVVMNEGANKGILVTTSDYGPDSYDFAKGKPLQLLSGGNLLHLLQQHGIRARIDIKEARRILGE